jgi:hypothetical protein
MELVVVGMRDCCYGWNWWLWGRVIAVTDGTGGCGDARLLLRMELVVVGMRDCCYGWNWWLWGLSLLLRMELVVVGMRD